MKSYQQLTQDQRYQIHAFLKASFSQAAIARQLGVDPSTISRELKRNRGLRGYRPKQAHQLAQARCQAKSNATRITPETWHSVEDCLKQDWSPEQVSGTFKAQGESAPSHERIYQYVYADKRQGGDLHLHLRCQKNAANATVNMTVVGKLPIAKALISARSLSPTKSELATGKLTRSSARTINKLLFRSSSVGRS